MNDHRDKINRIAILLRGKGLWIAGLLAMIALWALPALGLAQGGAGSPGSLATVVLILLILGWLFLYGLIVERARVRPASRRKA